MAIEVNCKKLFKNIRGEGKGSFGSVTIAKSKRGMDKARAHSEQGTHGVRICERISPYEQSIFKAYRSCAGGN